MIKGNEEDILLLLFKQFKSGNEKAFEFFFNKHYSHILGFCIQFIYDESDAKNITQEAFLNLWEHRKNIKKPKGIETYLYTYAKSKCLNAIRHNKVKEKYKNHTLNKKEQTINLEVLKSMEFDTLSLNELQALIDKSLNELPKKTKTIFIKKRFDNKKNSEIAKELGISIKTVESHMTTALKVLRVKLASYLSSLF
ncbi:RNA polymerase sigma-70 factor [Seonamhaeicola algicola]|uniref:RNA polymerase sigma-70 factor n=1 Tax=Seonamhaeicola algicola TaxID=1719036 RepID=A0A5C7AVC1_9FLAO|nr:RNA polymerase sigma-70 factor [Seonamhaeicola algicola]TXE09712.1 RNA polymerase sigma-70 factor [Seonamhaeicola algicola]